MAEWCCRLGELPQALGPLQGALGAGCNVAGRQHTIQPLPGRACNAAHARVCLQGKGATTPFILESRGLQRQLGNHVLPCWSATKHQGPAWSLGELVYRHHGALTSRSVQQRLCHPRWTAFPGLKGLMPLQEGSILDTSVLALSDSPGPATLSWVYELLSPQRERKDDG